MMESEKEEKFIRLERKIEEQEDTIWQIDRTLNALDEYNQQMTRYMQSAAAFCQPGDYAYEEIMTTLQDTHRIHEDGRDFWTKEKRVIRAGIDDAEYEKKKMKK